MGEATAGARCQEGGAYGESHASTEPTDAPWAIAQRDSWTWSQRAPAKEHVWNASSWRPDEPQVAACRLASVRAGGQAGGQAGRHTYMLRDRERQRHTFASRYEYRHTATYSKQGTKTLKQCKAKHRLRGTAGPDRHGPGQSNDRRGQGMEGRQHTSTQASGPPPLSFFFLSTSPLSPCLSWEPKRPSFSFIYQRFPCSLHV